MAIATRKIVDCAKGGGSCTLKISGTEDEVVKAAVAHAISEHGYKDGPELRAQLRSMLEDEK